MMFDGTKLMRLTIPGEALLKNPLLCFKGLFDKQTGEDVTGRKCTAFYKGWKLTAHLEDDKWGRVEASGSWHKSFNNGIHNYNDFFLTNFIATLNEFSETLGINPIYQEVQGIEFGTNVRINFDVSIVLKSLLSFKGIPFERPIENPHYFQCKTREFIIKCYDKGRQFNLAENVLRFEIKVTSMRFFKQKGIDITTLSDLLNTHNYPKLGEMLMKYFRMILFANIEIDTSKLSPVDSELIIKGRNKDFWKRPDRKTFDTVSKYEAARKKQMREENRFRNLNNPPWYDIVERKIASKWKELTTLSDDVLSQIQQVITKWNVPNSRSFQA